MSSMSASAILRVARERAGMTLRELATVAGTSHTTLSAYEQRRTTPTTDTAERIVRAAGFNIDTTLSVHLPFDGESRGIELMQALELAALFPARHSPTVLFPRFPTNPASGSRRSAQ